MDAARAQGLAGLADFLRQHGWGGLRIQEAVANDQLLDQVGAAIRALGAGLLALEPQGSVLVQELTQLEVALLAEAEFGRGGQRAEAFTLAFVEHGELVDDFVVSRNGQAAARTLEGPVLGEVRREFKHETKVTEEGV